MSYETTCLCEVASKSLPSDGEMTGRIYGRGSCARSYPTASNVERTSETSIRRHVVGRGLTGRKAAATTGE